MRNILKCWIVILSAAALWVPLGATAKAQDRAMGEEVTWARGIEGQRKADLGDGTFLNPIMPGDHPDPSIVRDGEDYYMTFSSFDAYPGLQIWHSRDLVNWMPIGAALRKNVGSVWAPDLTKHDGKYYIYFPGKSRRSSNYVVWAENIEGPWSDPIDLRIGGIDPGHAVGSDGRRYLFMSGGNMVELAADGLSVVGEMRHVYDGWRYPEEWVVESYSMEGPKIVKRGEYYYMVLAVGGTAGPPTSHMVIVARGKSIEGPWEDDPNNPVIKTWHRDEKWWSKGHATLFEGPGGQWYMVYHAYENGFYTLGRQTLLEPVEWTADGWVKPVGYDTAKPIPMPGGEAVEHGFAFSDDFSTNKMGLQWSFHKGDADDVDRYRYEDGALVMEGRGSSPADCSPLSFVVGDHAYQVEVEMEVSGGATAGLLMFYNERLYAGIGFGEELFVRHRYGLDQPREGMQGVGNRLWMRLVNDRNVLIMYTSLDGKEWTKYPKVMETSGFHHNTVGDFLSLRPAIYAAGQGEVRFRNFKYRALEGQMD